MTNKYDSKHEAITLGLSYAGRTDLCTNDKGEILGLDEILKNSEIKIVNDTIEQFGYVHEDCTMIEFKNSRDVVVRLASTKFRDGFDLWFIDPKSGFSMRA